ncbi:microtubule binding protein [Rhizopogon salebrosus TDB-379]|nr:microtubule binding protein [Rhizopogon salebrosus TDB-379]
MSRFVRASKYRHVFGQTAKKEHGYDNVKISSSAWDTNLVSASARYISVNWNASGGGAFAILPLPSPFAPVPNFPYKLPDVIPLARSHTAPVLDTDWSPHNDSIVASAGEDGKVMIWKVESSAFEDWGQDHWVPQDFDPVARIDASPRKIGQVLFHPTASNVLASASGEYTVKLWDLADTDRPRSVLTGHGDMIQSFAFNLTGTLMATTCRDRKLRLFDPRAGSEPVRIAEAHGGIKGARVVWMGDLDKVATTGFSKRSDRQLSIWETGGLENIQTTTIDQSAGVIMPFWSDNGILFLAGKGDGNIRYFEYESDTIFPLAEHKSVDPQRGICFLPRRALNVSECEIARAYKVSGTSVEPIAFIVPRKADSFQSDIYPAAASSEPTLSASEFFAGKAPTVKLVNLETGAVFNGAQSTFTPTHVPAPAFSTPPSVTKATSMPTPAPQTPVVSRSESAPGPVAPAPPRPTTPISESPVILTPPQASSGDDVKPTVLEAEVDRLNSELRAAREKIRNMELQVEGLKANARKAAQALMEG